MSGPGRCACSGLRGNQCGILLLHLYDGFRGQGWAFSVRQSHRDFRPDGLNALRLGILTEKSCDEKRQVQDRSAAPWWLRCNWQAAVTGRFKIKDRILFGGIGDGELRVVSLWGGVMYIMVLSRLKKEERIRKVLVLRIFVQILICVCGEENEKREHWGAYLGLYI